MEVHHHPEVEKKGFKEYILEGLMIFLAVMMGFFAESLRERIADGNREKEFMVSMIEDLKSVGAPAAELDPLVQLQAELQKLLAGASPADAEVGRVWSRAEAVLRAFAGAAPAAPGAGRRDSFWK